MKDEEKLAFEAKEEMEKLILQQQELKYKLCNPSYKWIDRCNELNKENSKLKKQLAKAVEALKTAYTFPSTMSLKEWCEQEIKKIKELEK